VDEQDRPLHRGDLDPDPLRQFERWFDEARAIVRAPEAMALATAGAGGSPSVRMVLLKHFATRPRGAQIGAHASQQSEVLASRDELERRVEELGAELGAHVARPARWGGFRLVPRAWEFWQHRDSVLARAAA
jgi:pyridoxine/pyridoxamine 5'-phosphate oxidase